MDLAERVVSVAEAALADHQYASFIDVLTGMRLLHNVQVWHNGRVQYLDEMVQGSAEKLRQVIATFQRWADQCGLRTEDLPPHDASARTPPKYRVAGQIPELEKIFRRHFLPPYSPELNPIERTWKLTHRLCLHNRYFQTLDDVVTAVEEQFGAWAAPNDTLRRLCAII